MGCELTLLYKLRMALLARRTGNPRSIRYGMVFPADSPRIIDDSKTLPRLNLEQNPTGDQLGQPHGDRLSTLPGGQVLGPPHFARGDAVLSSLHVLMEDVYVALFKDVVF